MTEKAKLILCHRKVLKELLLVQAHFANWQKSRELKIDHCIEFAMLGFVDKKNFLKE